MDINFTTQVSNNYKDVDSLQYPGQFYRLNLKDNSAKSPESLATSELTLPKLGANSAGP